jgi:hypothetical protein
MGWPFPLKFEDDHPSIVASSEQVEGGVPSNHIHGLVLTVGEDEVLSRVEDGAGRVVVMASACVYLPCLEYSTHLTFRYRNNKH